MIKFFLPIITLLMFQIYFAQTDSHEYFGQTPPEAVPELFAPKKITGYVHGLIAISPDRHEMYWVVNSGKEQIYYSKLEDSTWTKPARADFINSTYNVGSPVFCPDGSRLYFSSSDRPGGVGKSDAWYIEKTGIYWSTPINVGAPYNSANDEPAPLFTRKGYAYLTAGLQYSKEPPSSF